MLVKEKFRNEKRKSSSFNKVIREKTSICKTPPPHTHTNTNYYCQEKPRTTKNQWVQEPSFLQTWSLNKWEKWQSPNKNKWWRAAEFHLVYVFKVPEFRESKTQGFKFRNSYKFFPINSLICTCFHKTNFNWLPY